VANIKSQIKRIRTSERQRMRNKAVRSELKTAVRRFEELHTSGDKEAAEAQMHAAARKFDKAVSKGVVHKNTAANKKSAMAKKLSTM